MDLKIISFVPYLLYPPSSKTNYMPHPFLVLPIVPREAPTTHSVLAGLIWLCSLYYATVCIITSVMFFVKKLQVKKSAHTIVSTINPVISFPISLDLGLFLFMQKCPIPNMKIDVVISTDKCRHKWKYQYNFSY